MTGLYFSLNQLAGLELSKYDVDKLLIITTSNERRYWMVGLYWTTRILIDLKIFIVSNFQLNLGYVFNI